MPSGKLAVAVNPNATLTEAPVFNVEICNWMDSRRTIRVQHLNPYYALKWSSVILNDHPEKDSLTNENTPVGFPVVSVTYICVIVTLGVDDEPTTNVMWVIAGVYADLLDETKTV